MKRFDRLMENSHFLSIFYQARDKSERENLPLENCFMEIGLNRYKEWFPKMCLSWGITNLTQIRKFNEKVMSI